MLTQLTLEKTDHSYIKLSKEYNETLQGFLYNCINDPEFASFLHSHGYMQNKRSFRLFAFSGILQKPLSVDYQRKVLTFPARIDLMVSSVENEFFQSLFEMIYTSGKELRLGGNMIQVTGVKVFPPPDDLACGVQRVKTLSPVCCYSTVIMPNGKKRTIYYHPREKEFAALLRDNLIRKHMAFYGREPENKNLTMQLLTHPKEVVSNYKGFIIKSYLADLKLAGSDELLKMALESGVGSKNAQGHGLIVPQNMVVEVN